ncbi:MAG TPA: hypothetical protein VFB38_03065 [Chthonomonadaceae bacterium]|nr:hypothetical protein [Chthonomonadaceae bacterium]
MRRRDDIRAAMQRLLSPAARPESLASGDGLQSTLGASGDMPALALSEAPLRILQELQSTLHENGIEAEPVEIVQVMMEALSARPTLCRGLLAAYLLDA